MDLSAVNARPRTKPWSPAALRQRQNYGFPGFEVLESDLTTADNESSPAVPVQGINLIAMLN
jgi:hypothetical protein